MQAFYRDVRKLYNRVNLLALHIVHILIDLKPDLFLDIQIILHILFGLWNFAYQDFKITIWQQEILSVVSVWPKNEQPKCG